MVDPITVATINSALQAAAGEMSEALRRSSYSPIIREMLDFSCGIFTPAGEMVAQAETIPAMLGAMGFALRELVGEYPLNSIDEGDVFIANDPYRGGTHTPDIHIFGPIFATGRLIGWTGTLAHHVDIGGTNPGTEGYANRSIFEEGLRFPPIRLFEAGRAVVPLFQYIEANVREPRATLGDLRAQVAAVRLGAGRVAQLAEKYQPDVLAESSRQTLDQTEKRLRASIAARPDGRAAAVGHLDDDGLGGNSVRIQVSVEIQGDRAIIDFEGSAPQTGGGMNAPKTAVMASALFAIKAVFDPDGMPNGGIARPLEVRLPEGTVVNPRYPAAVSVRHLTAQRITDTIVRALQELCPDSGVAGAFVGFSSLAVEGPHPRMDRLTVMQDDLGGGMGGGIHHDGLDAVDTYLGNVGLLPAEVCEMQYPVRVVRTELVPDTGGIGRHRGGLGMLRIYEFTADCDLVAYTEQSALMHAAWGAAGGGNGAPASLTLVRGNGTTERIQKARLQVHAGDRLVMISGGGGGYGLPAEREADLLERDLLEGKVTAQASADPERVLGAG